LLQHHRQRVKALPERVIRVTSDSARPPSLVLVIYGENSGGYGECLAANGFRVAEAHTGLQGFDRAVALRPDLIVLDFGLDGDTVALLRFDPATSDIPIVALAELTTLHESLHPSSPEGHEGDS
jgi:CheY-like chemotaxis protein